MLPDYFQILGIPRDASEMEIKRAYRKKALEYHPAANHSADAIDNFILVNEAYEILIHKNTHQIYLHDFGTAHDPLKYQVYSYWINDARNRAAQFAGMSIDGFRSTKFFRDSHIYSKTSLQIFFALGILFLIVPFFVLILMEEKWGVAGILISVFICWPIGLYFFALAANGFQSMKKYLT
jgi:DnaJ domain